ncbi:MAG: AAA family ATPase [bacterium]
MRKFSIFLSSPSDVRVEREEARRVIEQLGREFANQATIGSYFWESQPLEAAKAPQESLREAASCDIVVGVVWSRMGTPLTGDRYKRADGTRYESGTAYELETALEAGRARGTPRVLLYCNSRPVNYPAKTWEDAKQQHERLTAFLERQIRTDDGAWKGAYKGYASAQEFAQLLGEDLTELVTRALSVSETGGDEDPPWPDSPYRGLEAFDLQHEAIFFGRTGAITGILDQLNRQAADARPFVLVLGVSGSGKSSLLRAGVLPRLFRARAVGAIEVWRHAILRPRQAGADPLAALAQALIGPTALPCLAAGEVTAERLRNALDETVGALRESLLQAGQLERGKQAKTIDDYIDSLERDERTAEANEVRAKLSDLKAPKVGLVLVIDQMEELFDEQITREQRAAFMAVVNRLVRRGVHVLATLRSDFYARCHELPELDELKLGNGQYDLRWPDAAEVGQMIRLPARLAALRFEAHPKTGQLLDERLRDDAIASPQNLPLLQFVLDALYAQRTADRVLTHAAYDAMGGLEGAINRRARDTWDRLDPTARNTAGDVFAHLVQISPAAPSLGETSGERVQRRYARMATLASDPHRRAFIDAFIGARLFIATDQNGESCVTLAHETLITHFEPLRSWVQSHSEQLRARSRLAAAAALWNCAGRDPGDLYRGRALDEARALQRDGWLSLDDVETQFIAASAGARRGRRLSLGAAATGALVVLSITGWLGIRAYVARQTADAQQLVSDAEAARERRPQDSVRLARKATALRPAIGAPALRRNLAVDRQLRWAADPGQVRAVALGTRKPIIVVGTWNGAFVRDISLSDHPRALDPDDNVEAVSLTPDDAIVLTAGAKGVRLWRDGAEIADLPVEHRPVASAAFAPDGRHLAYIDGHRLRVWTSDGTWTSGSLTEQQLEEYGAGIQFAFTPDSRPKVTQSNDIAFSPDGRFALSGYEDGTATIWGEPDAPIRLKGHTGPITAVEYSARGRFVATASTDGTAIVWEASTGEPIARLAGHDSAVRGLAFSAEDHLLATGADDGVRLWASDDAGRPMRHDDAVNAAVFSDDGQYLLTASSDGAARAWNAVGELIATITPPPLASGPAALRYVAMDRQGRWLATGDDGSTVAIWDARSCAHIAEVSCAAGETLRFVTFAHDGALLIAASDGMLQRWRAADWAHEGPDVDLGALTTAAISPQDDALVAAGGSDGAVRLWSLGPTATSRSLAGANGRVNDLAFSDDGRLLIASAADGGAHIWDVASGRHAVTLRPARTQTPMRSARFRPGANAQVITADEEGRVRIWDSATGTEIGELPGHTGPVMQVAFRPDGLAVATASADGTARIHRWFDFVPVDELLRRSKESRAIPTPAAATMFACPRPPRSDPPAAWPKVALWSAPAQ